MWPTLIPVITGLLDKFIPDQQTAADAKLKALDMAQKGELSYLDAEVRLALGQIDVNKIEAGTDSFRGGWRPAVGWVCVLSLAMQFVIAPLLVWVSRLSGYDVEFPKLDNDALLTILMGMLGLGAMRTHEKVKGLK